MTLFTRAVARDFRMLFGRCVAGRPRGPAPPVVVQVRDEKKTIAATTADGVTLMHTSPGPKESEELLVLPSMVLAEAEGCSDDEVTLDRQSRVRGTLKWYAGATRRSLPVELILPGKQHDLPAHPKLTAVSGPLLAALHECGRMAARESGRYALSKVQLQGKAGRIVGTDGKAALLWGGFDFPLEDAVLVPALPVFGAKPLSRLTEVKLGRTVTHLVVGVGPWAVWLPIDVRAKYPDVAAVVPRRAPTTVEMNEADAAQLLPALPGLPGADHELRPVTLEAAEGTVRIGAFAEEKDSKEGEVRQVVLARSTAAGPPARAVLDRRVLARALSLGCRTFRLTPEKPLVAEAGNLTLVAAQLDPVLAAPPPDNPPAASKPDADANPVPNTQRRTEMKPEANGHASPRGDPADPLELAEALRDVLADATAKAARLVAALRQGKKEKKVLASVLTNLKQLNLGGSS